MTGRRESGVRPFLKWAGGKFSLTERILALLPPRRTLVEPFVGSGAVFLNSDYRRYVLNDINADLITLYRILQAEGPTFIGDARRYFNARHNAPETYYRLRARFNGSRDPYERSLLFLYLNRHGYNGLCRYNRSGGFNVPFGRYKAPYFPEKEMQHFHAKSRHATFTCNPYPVTFARARKGQAVYCDPPYVPLSQTANFTDYAASGFSMEDQRSLGGIARRAARRGIPVLISNHDTPLTREIYGTARITSVEVRRTISRDGANRGHARELMALFGTAE